MKVKNIIKNTLLSINEPELYKTISVNIESSIPETEKSVLTTLINCINATNNLIASEYYYLKDSIKLNSNGKISFSNISNSVVINDILKVEKCGVAIPFKVLNNYIKTDCGEVEVFYSYLPTEVKSINETITNYPIKINERIFSYGVISEYYYILGMYDDASIWDLRFKNSLQNAIRPKHEIKIKQRLWL